MQHLKQPKTTHRTKVMTPNRPRTEHELHSLQLSITFTSEYELLHTPCVWSLSSPLLRVNPTEQICTRQAHSDTLWHTLIIRGTMQWK